ncbi:hypothetical protein APHCR_0355 [Anaplasma phagocytophilum str. CR1007]|nr:hypothetical protein EPHNCH_1175 [Anaplasma phagocytophilum str. NCH-1]KJV83606.1 hypothetical protein APHHGE2_1153 [Anaplasma phagocytophilum str. HGE2]KJZ98626.1 hypothetical protein APHCR_0355 [Anaplasma phagocytophilum str. CR1007]KKA00371.1 hypothetical protein APHDU1_0153 [Anaplasma phagocytophilum]
MQIIDADVYWRYPLSSSAAVLQFNSIVNTEVLSTSSDELHF